MNTKHFDFQAEIATLNRKIERLERTTSTGVLQTILASGADGYITPGDILTNGAAAVLLTGCGVALGSGAGLIVGAFGASIPGAELGGGLGLVVSSVAVGTRVLLDLQLIGNDPAPIYPEAQVQSNGPEMGLRIEIEGGGYFILAPKMARSLVLKIAKKTARMYYMPGGKDLNFSQRQLGQYWGEHLPQVKDKLKTFGLLEAAKNNTLKFTQEGARWLTRVMSEQ